MWEVLLPLISFWMSFRVTPKKIDALLSEKSGAAQNNAEFAAPEAVRAASVQLTARAYKDLRDYMVVNASFRLVWAGSVRSPASFCRFVRAVTAQVCALDA